MDAAADTVLMPCAHGGICYKCADALVRKHFLTGGAKCIHCRASVESLVRLGEMNDLVAQGVEIEIPKATIIVRSKQ
jgi:pyrimidine deaminase RibD-like protein